jgi:hypothetical protein
MVTKPVRSSIKGFSNLNTESIGSHLGDNELRVLENMVYSGRGIILKRKGLYLYKSNAQWGSSVKVVSGVDFDLTASDPREIYALSDGRLYHCEVSQLDSEASYTEVLSAAAVPATPALLAGESVYMEVINNKISITDGSPHRYYLDSALTLKLAPDPLGYFFEVTVLSAAAATTGAVYTNGTLTFKVHETKVTTDGTTLKLRQSGGDYRAASTGTLTRTSGTGDATIAYTAITYVENYIAQGTHEGRLVLLSDAGILYLSATNNILDMDGDDTTYFEYSKEDSMIVKGVTSFKRATVITSSNQALRRAAISTLTGYRRYNETLAERNEGLFKIQRESNFLGVLGRSGAEVGNGFIGLTKNGFIGFSALDANSEFGIVDIDYISTDIQALVNRVNWNFSDEIIGAVDLDNQRYMCAVPLDSNELCNVVFVYDFKHSTQKTTFTPAQHMWSVFAYQLGDEYISTMFTIRGKVFIADTAGNIYETEADNVYTDNGEFYPCQFVTKSFDRDDVISKKQWATIAPHLLVFDEDNFNIQIYGIVDENLLDVDPVTLENLDDVDAIPYALVIAPWSLDDEDVWTNSPFDVWEAEWATELIIPLNDGIMDGRQCAVMVRDRGSATKWGASGVSIVSIDYTDYADTR